MSFTNTQAETTTERKPPTIADIVREKTDDGALIIDFFTDVMTGRIEGAELCHRIDAAKQLVKYGSKDAAEFIAKYKGVPCGHSINGRPDPADPCTAADRSLVAVTLNAPPTLTRDFLTVLSGIDEFLMARLIRAQTADGVTIIEFLDDVMQDRADGFKTHHRIAAAKELIVHIVRDEQPSHTPTPSTTPSPSTGEGGARPESPPRSEGDSPVVPAQTEGNPDNSTVIPAKAGIQEGGVARPSKAGVHPEPSSIVVPADAGTQGGGGGRNTAANPARTEPALSTAEGPRPELTEGPANSLSVLPTKEPAQGPALPSLPQLTTNNQQLETLPARPLEQHWHEPDLYGAPIDSTHPGRSPPW